ncbi:MAG TPA: (2Fe-2S)-binding protein [Bradyrhizobium sp.]
MIICSCNVLSDHDVRRVMTAAASQPRTASDLYGCLGCSAQCGRCARTIKRIMDEALSASSCCCRKTSLPPAPVVRAGDLRTGSSSWSASRHGGNRSARKSGSTGPNWGSPSG